MLVQKSPAFPERYSPDAIPVYTVPGRLGLWLCVNDKNGVFRMPRFRLYDE